MTEPRRSTEWPLGTELPATWFYLVILLILFALVAMVYSTSDAVGPLDLERCAAIQSSIQTGTTPAP